MKVLRKIIAAFLSLSIMNFALIGVMALSLGETYLNRDFYESEFFVKTLYSDITDSVAQNLEEKNPQLNQFLSHEEVVEMVEEILPATALKKMAEEGFDQLEQNPLPETILISNETIKKNIRLYIEENPKALQYIDPNQVDYLASEIKIPLENLSPELQTTLQILSSQQQEIKIIFIIGMIGMNLFLFLILWRPFSKASGWITGTLAFSGAPLIPISLGIQQTAQKWVTIDNELVAHFIQPISDHIFLYGAILSGIAALSFVDYWILKKMEQRILI